MMQLTAMMTMLIDHIGLMFFPEQPVFRIIGRIAFPLYAYFLVQGYLHTSNLNRYVGRLIVLALLSQVPFMLALQRSDLNVIFTLLVSVAVLYFLDRISSETQRYLGLAGLLALPFLIPMDYGVYGIGLVLIYRYLSGWKMVVGHLALNALFFLLHGTSYWIQEFSIVGTVWIAWLPARANRLPKWVYRAFYPAHLAILYVVNRLLAF